MHNFLIISVTQKGLITTETLVKLWPNVMIGYVSTDDQVSNILQLLCKKWRHLVEVMQWFEEILILATDNTWLSSEKSRMVGIWFWRNMCACDIGPICFNPRAGTYKHFSKAGTPWPSILPYLLLNLLCT